MAQLWVYLQTTPLLGLAATLVAWEVAVLVSRIARGHVLDWRARGLAAGTAGHGLATARILPLDETAEAFGGLAIRLNGIVTAILVPFLAKLF